MAATTDVDAPHETTPLLGNGNANGTARQDEAPSSGVKPTSLLRRIATPEFRLLLAGFMITTGLCFTQVPCVPRRLPSRMHI